MIPKALHSTRNSRSLMKKKYRQLLVTVIFPKVTVLSFLYRILWYYSDILEILFLSIEEIEFLNRTGREIGANEYYFYSILQP